MWLTPNGKYCFADYSGSLWATEVIRILENMKFEENTGNPPVLGIELGLFSVSMKLGVERDEIESFSNIVFRPFAYIPVDAIRTIESLVPVCAEMTQIS